MSAALHESVFKNRLRVLSVATLIFCLDAATKTMVLHHLLPGQPVPIIPGVLQLTRIQNTGAAFSLFYEHPEILTLIAGMLFLAFFMYMLSKKTMNWMSLLGFGFVLGGAWGNLLDRIHLGGVTDFIDVVLVHFAIFNVADSFICIGVGLLLIDYVRYDSAARS